MFSKCFLRQRKVGVWKDERTNGEGFYWRKFRKFYYIQNKSNYFKSLIENLTTLSRTLKRLTFYGREDGGERVTEL